MSGLAQDLPHGWTLSTIESLAEQKGVAYGVLKPGPQIDGGIPMLRVTDVRSGGVDQSAIYRISDELDREYKRTKLRGGEVLVSIQGSVGRVAVVPTELAGANVSRTLAMVRLREPALAGWVQMALESPQAQHAMRQVIGGTTRDSLNLRDLRRFEIPVAPEPQRSTLLRLVEKLNQLNGSSGQHLAAARQAIERFRQSVLVAACSGRLTADWREAHSEPLPVLEGANEKRPKKVRLLGSYALDGMPDGWTWSQVENVLPPGGIFDGPFGSNLKSSDYTDSGARVVRLENIGHLRFIGEKKTYVSLSKYEALAKHAVRSGDIVFSSFVEEMVRVCVLPNDLDRDTLAKADCFTLRPVPGVDARYLALQLATPRSYGHLAGDIHGATRPRVNTTHVRGLPLPLCSLSEQIEIVNRWNLLTAAADHLVQRIDTASDHVERSSQAVLAKAFRGDLIPDESLLDSSGAT